MTRAIVSGLTAAFLIIFCPPGSAKNTGLVFVSNEGSDGLVVFDPKSGTKVMDLPTSRGPRDMHFNADHTKLYVACAGDDVIDIIDVANLEVVGKLLTPSRPDAFGIDEKRRRVYVPNREGSSLSVIDMDQNVIVQEVPTGVLPKGVFVSKDGHLVYVTAQAGDDYRIHLIDASSDSLVQDLAVETRLRRIAPTPDGKELWVSAELTGEIYIIDRYKFSVDGKIALLPPGVLKADVTLADLRITRDGKTAYVTLGRAANVAVVNVVTRKVEAYIPAGILSESLAISRDETTLYVADSYRSGITIIDLRTHNATGLVPVGRLPRAVVIDD
jgi:YVTN family beta-propeller protein